MASRADDRRLGNLGITRDDLLCVGEKGPSYTRDRYRTTDISSRPEEILVTFGKDGEDMSSVWP